MTPAMEYFFYTLLLVFLLAFLLMPFSTLFHELGHATVPLLTRMKTEIYIGSYGDARTSIHFRLGLLSIWVSLNPLKWNRGLCMTKEPLPFSLEVLSILAGPLASCILGAAATFMAITLDAHGFVKLLFVVFTFCAVIGLWVNLRVRNDAYTMADGSRVYNDGHRLKELFRSRRDERISAMVDNKDYAGAEKKVTAAMERRPTDEFLLRMMIVIKIHTEQHEAALAFYARLSAHHRLVAHDHAMKAYLLSLTGKEDEALKSYDAALEEDPDHALANNNKGYYLICEERYAEALFHVEKALAAEPEMAFAYSSRGHVKLKTGDAEGGLADILYSLRLDETNAYAYSNLGIYHLDKGNAAEALAHLRKAEELDNRVFMLTELIEQAETMLKSSSR